MLRLFARRQRTSMSAYFTSSLTAPRSLGLLASLRGGVSFPGRAARGPVAPRKMACRPAAGKASIRGSRHQLAHRGGAARSLPLLIFWYKMTRTELIIQPLKIAIGLAFGAYFVWWSLQVLDAVMGPAPSER